MSTSPYLQTRRCTVENKKVTPPSSSVVTRNGARKAKIQTRAMSAGAKPSATVIAAKKKILQKKKQNFVMEIKDHYQIAMESKTKVKGCTGFVTEPRMVEHRCLWDANYPECPERLTSVINRCEELKLIEQCKQYESRAATKSELCSLHSPSVYEIMETTHENKDIEYLEELSSKYDAIYIHPSSHELALIAAGSTIDMVDAIVSGEVQNGAAFVRPPGHHAMHAEPCGYCFYNNVALAATHAIHKRGLQRVLIVDWDVHHGQATQQMFYDDPRVVYFSIHRYEHGSFWPNLRQSDFHYIGTGLGTGYNFNVPLNKTGMNDGDYIAIWHQLLLPMALEFQPELIIISAGYDAAIGCPEGEMEVSPGCYATLLHMLMCVCPSVCVVLEGGYCLPSLAEGAALTLRTLLGHPPPKLHDIPEPSDSIRETILNCIYAQRNYWNCYKHQPTYTMTGAPNVCDGTKQKHTVSVKWEGDETRPDRFATRDCYPLQDDATKMKINKRLNNLRLVTDLTLPKYPVCYVYDEAMLKHRNICEPGHVECPERIMRIHERHRDYGLVERLHRVSASAAADEHILTVHAKSYLNRLKDLSTTKLRDLNNQKEQYDSVYFHPESLESAAFAVGSVLQCVEAVVSGECGGGVCVVRPPGHHAQSDTPSGFCLLNNAVCGAVHAIRAHGVRRVLLLDWDVHHGNGTQALTYDTDQILYISIHRYDNGSFFPNSKEADYTAVGAGKGEGYNINIPWNKRGLGDTEYMTAFTQIVLPIAYEYNPDLVIVSAGFDACVGDPLGGCKVSPECFGRMTQFLKGLAGGRIILCLEGGYNVTSISYAMTMCTKALLGDPIHHHYESKLTCHWSAVESIDNVIRIHKKYWRNLKFQVALPSEDVLEAPLPSRGLMDNNKNKCLLTDSALKIDYTKSIDSRSIKQFENSLEKCMANLKINRCEDGIHCGTDDEDDKTLESSKMNSNTVDKTDNVSEGRSQSASKLESGSLSGMCTDNEINCQTSGNTNGESKGGKEVILRQELGSSSGMCLGEGVETSSKLFGKGNSIEEGGKQTLVDYLSENMQAIVDGDMFAVIPVPWCPHLESLYTIPNNVKFEQGLKCVGCDHTVENWVCLHCYIIACARNVNGHMQAHYSSTGHALVLSLMDLSVWCNECDSYVDNALLYDAKNNAHRCKFNEDMPWCYGTDTIHMQ